MFLVRFFFEIKYGESFNLVRGKVLADVSQFEHSLSLGPVLSSMKVQKFNDTVAKVRVCLTNQSVVTVCQSPAAASYDGAKILEQLRELKMRLDGPTGPRLFIDSLVGVDPENTGSNTAETLHEQLQRLTGAGRTPDPPSEQTDTTT